MDDDDDEWGLSSVVNAVKAGAAKLAKSIGLPDLSGIFKKFKDMVSSKFGKITKILKAKIGPLVKKITKHLPMKFDLTSMFMGKKK